MSDSPSATSTLRGTPVVPGVAYGPALLVRGEVSPDAIARFDGSAYDEERALAAYDDAAIAVAEGFARRADKASDAAAEVLTASAGLARDKGLRSAVRKRLAAGDDLLASVHAGVEQFVQVFSSMGGLMAERVTDLRDIERRVVAHLVGEPEPGVQMPDRPAVLVAEDLAPSDTATLDPAVVLALVTERGGPTSHTAIIARQLAIPCVVGTSGAMTLVAGTPLLVDGVAGTIESSPDADEAERLVAADRAAREALETWSGPGETADGTRVKILANVADGESARAAASGPVEGVGLFRTELCFLNRADEPSAEEQASIYGEVLAPFSGRYVVVRTLDAGSDKPVAFATHEGEENPALGVRGLRLSFDNPDLLVRQLDGIAAAARETGTESWVMAPMVASATMDHFEEAAEAALAASDPASARDAVRRVLGA
jgi:phosphotransferase system enzyme I (PtsI)